MPSLDNPGVSSPMRSASPRVARVRRGAGVSEAALACRLVQQPFREVKGNDVDQHLLSDD